MTGTQGLSPSDIVSVAVSLSAGAVVGLGLNVFCVIGATQGVIDTTQRIRTYTSLQAVAADYGTAVPEYQAAVDWFGQTPQPPLMQIAAWARVSTGAVLYGNPLTVSQQAIGSWQAITNGSLQLVTGSGGGTLYPIASINLSSASTLTAVAAAITAAYVAAYSNSNLTVTYDTQNNRFVVNRTDSKGVNCILQFAVVDGVVGTDLSAKLLLQTGQGGYIVNGIAQESPQAGVTAARAASSTWYSCAFAVFNQGGMPGDQDSILTPAALLLVGQTVQAFSRPSVFLATCNDPNALLASSSTDLAAILGASNLNRTMIQYSSTDGFAAIAAFSTISQTNYLGAGTATTLKFKQPTLIPEVLGEAQYATLYTKNTNTFAQFSDNLAIELEGIMADGTFVDEIMNVDWMAQAVQTALINVLVQANSTKVPQTDEGMHALVAAADAVMAQSVTNGVTGPNLIWSGGNVGTLKTGDVLPSGWYIYQTPLNLQPAGNRALRQAPLITICFNFAGAVHSGSAQINVLR
jgi:hypothetical protein